MLQRFFLACVVVSTAVVSSAFAQGLGPFSRYPASTGRYPLDGGYYPGGARPGRPGYYGGALFQGCPACDSSVYSYCSQRLFHDSCCCGDGYYTDSFECQYLDCSFLHANSCQESSLIANCCCEDPYRAFRPLFSNYNNK